MQLKKLTWPAFLCDVTRLPDFSAKNREEIINRFTRIGLLTMALCTLAARPAGARCLGPGAPAKGELQCLTSIPIPGNPIQSFGSAWAAPNRSLFFLADQSNAGIDIFDTTSNTFVGRAGGFAGVQLSVSGSLNPRASGPNGVVSNGNWLYGSDANSTLRVFDITDPTNPKLVATLNTGGVSALNELGISSDGTWLMAVNDTDDPPFATLFAAGGSATTAITEIFVDTFEVAPGFGLPLGQPAWSDATQHFVLAVPTVANNPIVCNYGQLPGAIDCSGGIIVIDPRAVTSGTEHVAVTGKLHHCAPYGVTVGPRTNVMLGGDPTAFGPLYDQNETTIISEKTLQYVDVGNLAGAGQVWFDSGSNRFFAAAPFREPAGSSAVLGVVSGPTSFLLESIPQSSGSHSVASDANLCEVFVPQVAPASVVGAGRDSTNVGAQLCGTMNGCVAVYTIRL